jgi:hypothetical protein
VVAQTEIEFVHKKFDKFGTTSASSSELVHFCTIWEIY